MKRAMSMLNTVFKSGYADYPKFRMDELHARAKDHLNGDAYSGRGPTKSDVVSVLWEVNYDCLPREWVHECAERLFNELKL